MKKLLAFAIAVGTLLSGVAVLADGDTNISGVLKDSTLTITQKDGEGNAATLALFNNGKMCGVKTVKAIDGEYSFALAEDDLDKSMRVYFYGENGYDVDVVEEVPTPQPEVNKYPDTYERALDAIHAPAVVSGIASVNIDGEIYCELTLLYQGREIVVNVREKVVISSAPESMASLVGKSADYLCEGDVIHITPDMQGRVKSIEFIYRPDFADYYENGISTSGMIGADGYNEYYFGAPVEKYDNAVDIADGNGDITCLDVSPDAFIYTVSKGSRRNYAEITSANGVKAMPYTRIPDANYDGDRISWDGIEEIDYVLIRAVDDTVTEIIVFL